MTEISQDFMHCVCTLEQAKELTKEHEQFWVLNCDCRENSAKGKCEQSMIELCLHFEKADEPWCSELRKISRDELDDIFTEAKEKQLVPRPFKDFKTKSYILGICFCCSCCCEHFTKELEEGCGKNTLIESTDFETCVNCGECIDVCYFNARNLNEDELALNRNDCYGCGLCIDVCPENCIKMVHRIYEIT